jgi:glutamate synthase (NADPH/NADH) large chain
VLGQTGRNFAAGMSGGVAYVYDVDGQFASRCNTSMVALEKIGSAAEQKDPKHAGQFDDELLKKLVEDHHRHTGSLRAREILDNWSAARARFVKVFPGEYKRALAEMQQQASAKNKAVKA